MSQIAKTGTRIAALYEDKIKLDAVLSSVGLKSVSKSERKTIREELEIVLGSAIQHIKTSPKLEPYGKLQVRDIIEALKSIANKLNETSELLRGHETGFRSSHEVYLAGKVKEFLAKNSEIRQRPDEYLKDFCDRADTISHACVVAAADLRTIKGKAGNKPLTWFNEFTRVLVDIARRHSIPATIINSRGNGEPEGPFFELATAFEQLLYPKMRSPSHHARAKRISRALKTLGKQ